MIKDPIESLASIDREFGEHGGVNMSIEASTTFTVMEPDTMPALFEGDTEGREGCYLYGRHFNPTVFALGRELAALEGTEAAYCTASGMAAISAVLLQLCSVGDHIVASDTLYGGTYAFLNDYLPLKSGVTTTFVDLADADAVAAAITARTKLVYAESMSNPTLRVADIPGLANIAHGKSIPLVIDNTFSPLLIRPSAMGADIVVHSLTKFINGASDVIAGAVCASRDFIRELMDLRTGSLMILGPTMDPVTASKISLRIPHLALRVAEHSRRAEVFASRLADRGYKVVYPGLAQHPDHELMAKIRSNRYGYGGLFCLDMGSTNRANHLMDLLQNKYGFGYMAVSLGYSETLMSCSASSTSSELNQQALETAGITPGLLRISIGYTGSLEQRWRQFESALNELEVSKVA
ncbi:MAG: aminotransferase class I/II-fold pyridoxal phosphate-dependent enzyme [Gammaproteobacteria bacterium]|nr:aminotransferase class I/II-fold pyridoxal phosphate-dependent enzyme [Gammaproteobacteria bacterium]